MTITNYNRWANRSDENGFFNQHGGMLIALCLVAYVIYEWLYPIVEHILSK